MIESLYADIGYQSLTKNGQIVCGDHIEKIQRPDGSVVLVLADGLADEGERFITERKKAFGALGGGYGEEKKYDVNNAVWKLTDDAFKARLLKIYHDLPDEADA